MTSTSQLAFSKRAQIGCVAGLVGGFAIFVSIFVIDLRIGENPGTFYKVVGLATGTNGLEATLVGMVSHMLTASLIGTVFGLGSGIHRKLDVLSIKKGAIAGVTTGIVVFCVFFVPISTILIIPLVQSNNVASGEAGELLSNTNLIMIGSIELHVVFGVVMGTFFAIAVQQESKKFAPQTTAAT
ncbi:MAG: hypothetical protein ACREAX_01660 [Candidatus Nitrosotenuis sp.]